MKKIFIIIFIVICTIIGCVIGDSVATISSLKWLAIGGEIGFKSPLVIDLSFLQFTIGIWCKINVAGVICLIVSTIVSNKVFSWLKI